jgi:hypothetical protein
MGNPQAKWYADHLRKYHAGEAATALEAGAWRFVRCRATKAFGASISKSRLRGKMRRRPEAISRHKQAREEVNHAEGDFRLEPSELDPYRTPISRTPLTSTTMSHGSKQTTPGWGRPRCGVIRSRWPVATLPFAPAKTRKLCPHNCGSRMSARGTCQFIVL